MRDSFRAIFPQQNAFRIISKAFIKVTNMRPMAKDSGNEVFLPATSPSWGIQGLQRVVDARAV